MGRRGFTLIELLIVIGVITVALVIGHSVTNIYGTLSGIGAGILSGGLSIVLVILFSRWMWRRADRSLQELRENYRAIYRVIAVPADSKSMTMPEGAEVRVGDYGWEARPSRDDGLIYLQGLTLEWTVVWHGCFRPDQVERVATKTISQYDSWHPYWADPPPLPPCPFPVVERATSTFGRPHHSHRHFVSAANTLSSLERDAVGRLTFDRELQSECGAFPGSVTVSRK